MRRSVDAEGKGTAPKQADYESFEDFYANEQRRGDDVRLGEIVDGEYRWRILWLPRTNEVAAFAVFWADEHLHLQPGLDGEGPAAGPIPMPVPSLVNVVGIAGPRRGGTRHRSIGAHEPRRAAVRVPGSTTSICGKVNHEADPVLGCRRCGDRGLRATGVGAAG